MRNGLVPLAIAFLIAGLVPAHALALDLLGGLIKIETGNPQTEEKEVNSGPDQSGNPAQHNEKTELPYREGKVSFEAEKDIDTTYARIKREFGYRTKDELLGEPYGEFLIRDVSFKYEAVPGAVYNMKRRLTHKYRGVDRRHNLEVLIEKDGPGSLLIFTFWVQDPAITDLEDYGNSIVVRAKKSLGL